MSLSKYSRAKLIPDQHRLRVMDKNLLHEELIALTVKKCGPYFYSGFIWLTFQLKDLPFPSASTIRNLLNRYFNQINSALPLQQTK